MIKIIILILKNTLDSVLNANYRVLVLYKNRLVEPKEFTIASFYGQIHDTQKYTSSYNYDVLNKLYF